jgi:small multidrug resistance pump
MALSYYRQAAEKGEYLHWLYLAGAIGFEIVATSALKAAAGFTRPFPSIVVILGYVAAFYCLSVALRVIPMGIAYAIWSGIGIVVISLVGLLVYRQRLDGAALLGIALILAGTMVINLFSGARH